MRDEEYVFRQDAREKKITAQSARKRVGKTRKVTLPMDYLTKKELKAMNGDVKTFNLSRPMKWGEFRSMPNDLQAAYIKALREKFNVTNTALAKMFGVAKQTVLARFEVIGVATRIGAAGKRMSLQEANTWYAWLNGAEMPASEPETAAPIADPGNIVLDAASAAQLPNIPVTPAPDALSPRAGELEFCGYPEDIMRAVVALLGGAAVEMRVSWRPVSAEGVRDDGGI